MYRNLKSTAYFFGLATPLEQDPDIEVIRAPGDHNHVAEEDLVATTALIQQMLQQVVADPTLPVKRVYDQAVARAPAARLRLMPPFNAVKSRLERKRGRNDASRAPNHR